jgi:putative transposase
VHYEFLQLHLHRVVCKKLTPLIIKVKG